MTTARGQIQQARRAAFGIALCVVLLGSAASAQVSLTQAPVAEVYQPGGTLDIVVTVDVDTQAQINAVGLEQTLPAGWSYVTTVSGSVPGVTPVAGETGLIEFAWFPLPEDYPVTFTYRVEIAVGATGTKTLSGRALVLIDGVGEISASASLLVPKQGDGPFHTADINLSGTISLSELLRLIQFYNSGGFHCADFPGDTEDGYVPGLLGNKACAFHQSDYAPQDWQMSLSELLRAIQFYNTLGLYACPGENTEDGFCPGPAPE